MANLTEEILKFIGKHPNLTGSLFDFGGIVISIKKILKDLHDTQANVSFKTDKQGNTVIHIKMNTSQNISNIIWRLQLQYSDFLQKIQLQGIRIFVDTNTNRYLLTAKKD